MTKIEPEHKTEYVSAICYNCGKRSGVLIIDDNPIYSIERLQNYLIYNRVRIMCEECIHTEHEESCPCRLDNRTDE